MRPLLLASILLLASGCIFGGEDESDPPLARDAGPSGDADAGASDAPDSERDASRPTDASEDADTSRPSDGADADASRPNDTGDADPADAPGCGIEPPSCTKDGQSICEGAIVRTCQEDKRGCFSLSSVSIDCAATEEFCSVQGDNAQCQESECAPGSTTFCPDPVGSPRSVGLCAPGGSPNGARTCPTNEKCDPDMTGGCGRDAPSCRGLEAKAYTCQMSGTMAQPRKRIQCGLKSGAATLEAIPAPCARDEGCVEGACEAHECARVSTVCATEPNQLLVCELDQDGRRVQRFDNCPLDQTCAAGACIRNPDDCSGFAIGSRWCAGFAGNQFRQCDNIDSGRRRWSASMNCPSGEVCSGTKGNALCEAVPPPPVCVNTCTQLEWQSGTTQCGGLGGVEKCQPITVGGVTCYQWQSSGSCLSTVPMTWQGCESATQGTFCLSNGCVSRTCDALGCSPAMGCTPL